MRSRPRWGAQHGWLGHQRVPRLSHSYLGSRSRAHRSHVWEQRYEGLNRGVFTELRPASKRVLDRDQWDVGAEDGVLIPGRVIGVEQASVGTRPREKRACASIRHATMCHVFGDVKAKQPKSARPRANSSPVESLCDHRLQSMASASTNSGKWGASGARRSPSLRFIRGAPRRIGISGELLLPGAPRAPPGAAKTPGLQVEWTGAAYAATAYS